MIVERFPELASLSASEQLQLAAELARKALENDQSPALTPKAVEILEARLDHLLANPESGVDWEVLRD